LALVDSLGSCVPSDLLKFLKPGQVSPDLIIAVSLAMLSSKEPQAQRPPNEHIRIPLDAVASSSNPLAERTLYIVADRARNSRVKLEAVRRLGRVATGTKSRQFLRDVAREGTVAPMNYQNDSITPDMMKEAALFSLGEVQKAAKADVDAILEVLSQEADDVGDSAVFRAGTQALATTARAADLGHILDLAEKCPPSPMILRVLCACSSLTSRTLLREKARIVPLFIRALDRYQEGKELHEPAQRLARRLSCQDLVEGVLERYSGDCLDQARGQLAATVMESYSCPDDVLTKAYLAFARAECNAHMSSPCVQGLKRCAQSGKAKYIITQLVQNHNHPGYRRMFIAGAALPVAGGMKALVAHVCDALDSIQDAGRRTQAAWPCIVGIIRASVADIEDAPQFEDLNQFRQRSHHQGGRPETPLQVLVRLLGNAEAEQSGLPWLAKRLASGETEPSAVTLAQCILGFDDDLSRLFIREVFGAAFACEKPTECPEDSGLHKIEELAFSCCDQWLRDELPGLLMYEGRLNKYVLDVMRRTLPDFVSRVEEALTEVKSARDATALLDAVAKKGDSDSIRLLGRAISFVSGHIREVSVVRMKALRHVSDVLADEDVSIPAEIRNELLSQIHQRFEDPREVRLLAYAVAGTTADPVSITHLRARLQTDSDAKGKSGIKTALKRIRERLLTERPGWGEAESLKQWLKHVGDLGDDALLASVTDILKTPHPNRAVRVAALDCLANLKSRKAILVIDEFVAETSPSGDVLQAARHAKAVLMDRKDLSLREVLAEVFPDDSVVFDLSIDYQVIFGARLARIARALSEAITQHQSCHWDDFVTKLDGLCELIVRHIYDKYPHLLGIDQVQAQKMVRRDYANRLSMSQFRQAFPAAQPLLESIHATRYEATTAHVEDRDGSEKPGVGREEAELSLEQFRMAFTKMVSTLTAPGNGTASGGGDCASSDSQALPGPKIDGSG